ncbi:MAG TPA: FHA domain-containing protein [Xanthomonadales bacterium]|nr:FHA domain-containing protein [Xanthomonadales bacterium]
MNTYCLKGASGKVVNQCFGLEERTVVGRSASCDLVIDDENVAPRHIEIILDEQGGLRLKQLDSSFETRVNGKLVAQSSLSSGDEIRIGSCRWVLQAPGLRPKKVLTGAAVKQKRSYLPWLLVLLLLAAAILAWQRGWIPL